MTETKADEGVLQDKGIGGSGAWQSALTMLQSATPPHIAQDAEVMTAIWRVRRRG